MTLYAVYVRPDAPPAAVPDRFSWFAALLPPVFGLVHGIWLMPLSWLAVVVGLGLASRLIGTDAAFWLYCLSTMLVGFEAGTIRRWRLGRTGWSYRTEIVAADEDLAVSEFLKAAR